MSLPGNKEEYWKVRSASQKLWDEANEIYRKKYAKEIKTLMDLKKQEEDDYEDVVYKCVYEMRRGEEFDDESEEQAYEDEWYRSPRFEMSYFTEDESEPPLPGEPITIYLQPTPHLCNTITFFTRCVVPKCGGDATSEGKFLCCTEHKDRKITIDFLVDVMHRSLENCIEEQKEALKREPKPEKLVKVDVYLGDDKYKIFHIDLVSSEIVSGKVVEKELYGP